MASICLNGMQFMQLSICLNGLQFMQLNSLCEQKKDFFINHTSADSERFPQLYEKRSDF